jgi:beta-galactosidase/beta-glucuronidase
MLRDYIMQAGQECIVVRNDEKSIEEISGLDFDSIVISPGPKTPSEAGITMDLGAETYTGHLSGASGYWGVFRFIPSHSQSAYAWQDEHNATYRP